MTQRGFIIPALPLYVWLLIGAGVAVFGMGAVIRWQSGQIDALRQELAKSEAQVVLWTDAANTCSAATEKAAAEAQKRARMAQDALEAARKGAAKAESEIARLRGAKATGGECLAGQAVTQVRKGLKP